MISGQDLRFAMRKFTTGVTIITVLKEDGAVCAMIANSISSISLDPPLLLVCVGHNRNTLKYIQDSGKFAIYILRKDDEHIARYCASDEKDRAEKLPAEYEFNHRGTPKLKNNLAFIDCDVMAKHAYGDHTLFVGEVRVAEAKKGDPLVFYDGQFTGIETDKL